jgi:hypothetical protein
MICPNGRCGRWNLIRKQVHQSLDRQGGAVVRKSNRVLVVRIRQDFCLKITELQPSAS